MRNRVRGRQREAGVKIVRKRKIQKERKKEVEEEKTCKQR